MLKVRFISEDRIPLSRLIWEAVSSYLGGQVSSNVQTRLKLAEDPGQCHCAAAQRKRADKAQIIEW